MNFVELSQKLFALNRNATILLPTQVMQENWLDDNGIDPKSGIKSYGVLIVEKGSVDLRAKVDANNAHGYVTIKRYNAGEVILMRAIAAKTPEGVELDLLSQDNSVIQSTSWNQFKQLAFDGFDPSPILASSLNGVHDLLSRFRAERCYSGEQRLALAIAQAISSDNSLHNLYLSATKPNDIEKYIRLDVVLRQVSREWGVSGGTLNKARHTLTEEGVIVSKQGRQTFIIDPYVFSQYLIKTGTVTDLS